MIKLSNFFKIPKFSVINSPFRIKLSLFSIKSPLLKYEGDFESKSLILENKSEKQEI